MKNKLYKENGEQKSNYKNIAVGLLKGTITV